MTPAPDLPEPSAAPPEPLLGTAYPPDDEDDEEPATSDEAFIAAQQAEAEAAKARFANVPPGVEIQDGTVPKIALDGDYRKGDRGRWVPQVQVAVVKAGYPIRVDGYFGPKTATAVAAFQAANDLPADGVVDGATARALGFA